MKNGLCHLYYGNGKGKTTAAVGLAVRMLGSGQKVIFVQFLKGNKSSELTSLKKLEATVLTGDAAQKFTFCMDGEEKKLCACQQKDRLRLAAQCVQSENAALIVLDEVVDAVEKGFLQKEALLTIFTMTPRPEIVLTGHSAPAWAREYADYITCFQCEKHPYEKGVPARKGVEY